MPKKANARLPGKPAPVTASARAAGTSRKLGWPFVVLGVAIALAGYYVLHYLQLWEGGVVFGIGGVLVMWGMSRNRK
ncbi:MAG TPA: hypothetical protein VMC79_15435 [Rectinemataceae bacterium]|nr:hypothetical protein [Rectinemataceae bacterium]